MRIWRLIEDISRSGSFNMAADQVLLENYSRDSYPVFRVYDWECPTLSLGRNEKLDRHIDLEVCSNLGIPVVRRTTGGKAVLHGFDLTYSLVGGVLDQNFNGGVLDNYRFLAQGFYAFFKKLGLKPELQERSRKKKKTDPHVCFAEPSAYEILVEGRKIIGSAQRIRNLRGPDTSSYRVFLQHGSIPLNDSVPLIAQIFPYSREENLRNDMHSLESAGIYPELSKQELRQQLLECLEETFELEWEQRGWSEEELSMISDCETALAIGNPITPITYRKHGNQTIRDRGTDLCF
ncbi:MAG TPA: lipoate--protein ligase family protein [Deltaproteobacteria bacterium]|nr:lipoate--protein ligase family protein [Deltaproteobacteria bacterium]